LKKQLNLHFTISMDGLQYYESDEDDDDDEESEVTRGTVNLVEEAVFVRTTPHTRGNWVGHIYISVQVDSSFFDTEITALCTWLEDHGHSLSLAKHKSFHISLSRTFYVQFAFIESIVAKLQARLDTEPAFCVRASDCCLLVNEEETRSFLALLLYPNPALGRLVEHVDDVLQEYKLQTYYESPKFHVSLGSFAGTIEKHDTVRLTSSRPVLSVTHIHGSFGNRKFSIPLKET
jgi:hypothetical protein